MPLPCRVGSAVAVVVSVPPEAPAPEPEAPSPPWVLLSLPATAAAERLGVDGCGGPKLGAPRCQLAAAVPGLYTGPGDSQP